MKKVCVLLAALLLIVQLVSSHGLPGTRSITGSPVAPAFAGSTQSATTRAVESSGIGITVAGGNGFGSAANQLYSPNSVFVDQTGNLFITDLSNHRIQKWAPGALSGTTVAGGNGQGAAPSQLNVPTYVSVDVSGNVYVLDANNARVQKWAPGAPAGVTVAGGNSGGTPPNQLWAPYGVFVDQSGSIYVSNQGDYRILKWAPGASAGITVAGGNGTGPAANQLSIPLGIFVDPAGNIYVAESFNHRVSKWAPGASAGITVAGGNGPGTAANQLDFPTAVSVDANGTVYIADHNNHRIQKWIQGASAGITVAGGNGPGSAATQLSSPRDVFVDARGDIYVADAGNSRIQKFESDAGLTYRYYEGSWNTLPDFSTLTPQQTGRSANVDISTRTPGRNDNFAFIWEGNINIPAPGNYTFEIISDDGSNLYFNIPYSATAAPTVNNDGVHASKSATATVNVPAAGAYPITVTYFENTGGEQMQVYWTGPGIPRQLIPDAAFTSTGGSDKIPPSAPSNLHVVSKGGDYIILDWDDATDNTAVSGYDVYVGGVKKYTAMGSQITAGNLSPNTSYTFTVKALDLAGNSSTFSNAITETTAAIVNGLTYKYYEGTFNALPDFKTLTPVKTGSSPGVDPGVRTPGRNDNFAFVWEGYINITTTGIYTFETVSDDGSKLYFNTLYDPSATAIVNNDGLHAPTSASGMVNIGAPGVYPISITYFEKDGGEQMQVYWTRPGMARQLIPDSAFTQTPPPANGLTYKYIQGFWNELPDFNAFTPTRSGTSKNVDISVRTPNINDHFAFVWQGYINIPVAGNYTFETVSDDGSKLYFNTLYDPAAIATVNNDGLHAPVSATGTVNVPLPGVYPIAITYFEREGGEQMQVYWSGPGIPRQLVPDAAFAGSTREFVPPTSPQNLRALYAGPGYIHVDWNNSTDNIGVAEYEVRVFTSEGVLVRTYRCAESASTIDSLMPDTEYFILLRAIDLEGNFSDRIESFDYYTRTRTTAVANGLNYRYYEGVWNTLPNFNTLTPVKWGASPNVDLSVRNAGVNDNFGFVWEGYIRIPAPGSYTFETVSDDGSKLYFNSFYVPGATALVNNDGLHPTRSASGTVSIAAAGLYPISITFFEKDGGETMQVYWSGPGIARQLIPNSAFMQLPAGSQPVITGTDNMKSPSGDMPETGTLITRIYPNPFSSHLNIDFYNASAANDINLCMYDLKGRLVYSHHAGNMQKGNVTLKANLNGHMFPPGVYMAGVKINGVPSKMIKLVKRE